MQQSRNCGLCVNTAFNYCRADKAEPSSLISTQQQLNEDEPIVEQPICSDYETESLETHSTKSVVLSTSESEPLKRLEFIK